MNLRRRTRRDIVKTSVGPAAFERRLGNQSEPAFPDCRAAAGENALRRAKAIDRGHCIARGLMLKLNIDATFGIRAVANGAVPTAAWRAA